MKHYKRNQKYIAQGALTNSKHEDSHIKGIYPKIVTKGLASRLVDESGKEYIDFICGLGTNLFGYGNRQIINKVTEAMQFGMSHSFPSHIEGIAAETLTEIFPWLEKFKFLCTGSEACSAAIRMARSYTGRKTVLVEGYHGFHDAFVSLTPPATGVPKHPDMKLLAGCEIDESIAAVIIEPIITDHSVERVQWLQDLQDKCKDSGTVLIFDEVITGFRYNKHSVSKQYGIYPDLICLGKAMGSGLPIACVAGNKDILDGDYFVSSTNAGSTAGLSAAIAAVGLLTGSTDFMIERLWEAGEYFINKFNSIYEDVQIEGYPTRGVFKGDTLKKALFFQEMCRAGVLFGPSFFFNFGHVKDSEYVLDICRSVLSRISRDEISLEGEMPKSPFAAKVRKE